MRRIQAKNHSTSAWLRWIIVKSSCHRQVIGKHLSLGRMNLLCYEDQTDAIQAGTRQHGYRFYESLDFDVYQITKKGIAPNMDEYLLLLRLDKRQKEATKRDCQHLDSNLR